jgi:hypothetical protein
MRSPRSLLALLAALLLAVPAVSAGAEETAPPPGDISDNLTYVATIPEMKTAVSLAFMGSTMFVSAATGVYSYDIKDPAKPTRLGALPMYIWENEDVQLDSKRKLLIVSRDPRGFTTQATPGSTFPYGMIQVIDVSNPAVMRQVSQIVIGAGHTASCINACTYLWAGGPYANKQTQPTWTGRPIIGVDLRDPLAPKECPKPIDLGRNDGVTDYAHDVQVDPRGIAWVSGAGGVRGYWTSGTHRNPVTGKVETATGCSPVPYAGGGSDEEATPSRFMHNAWRNPNIAIGKRRGDVLIATEEAITSSCESSGRAVTYDLAGSYRGEGFRNIARTKFRLKTLDTWTPEDAEGSTGCASAHYLADRGDGVLAWSFYGQGTRLLDVRNPRNIRQVGYYRPNDASSFAPYWYAGHLFIADHARGIDIVKLAPSAKSARSLPTLVAPPRSVPAPITFRPSEQWGLLCPVTPV